MPGACHLFFTVTYPAFGRRMLQFITKLFQSFNPLSFTALRRNLPFHQKEPRIIEESRGPFAVERYLKGTYSLVYSTLLFQEKVVLKQEQSCGKAVLIHVSFFFKIRRLVILMDSVVFTTLLPQWTCYPKKNAGVDNVSELFM